MNKSEKNNNFPPIMWRGTGVGLHYLKIALRNILKYKVQNVICVLSIAASAMLLVVVSSFIGEFHTMEILEKPYGEQVVYGHFLLPNENGQLDYSQDIMRFALADGLKSAEKIFTVEVDRSVCEVTATVDGKERTLQTDTHGLMSDFMNWWGVRSRVTGGECAELEPGTVIMTERTARQLFGRIDVVGEKLDVRWFSDATLEYHTFRVADVVKPSPYDPFNYSSGIYAPIDSLRMMVGATYIQLREGKTKDDLEAELTAKLEGTGGVFVLYFYHEQYSDNINTVRNISNSTLAFLILFLAVCVVGYMRMQTQLFRIRQREIALRTVVGAKRWQLYVQFSVEVLLILTLALSLTMAFNTLMRSYLTKNVPILTNEIYVQFADFMPRTLCIFAVIAVLCLATVALVIRSIRKRQTGLAMQLRPSRNSFASVATMSVQMFLSTFLMAALVIFFAFGRKEMKGLNIPENDEFYRRCIVVQNTGCYGGRLQQQLIDLVEKSNNMERVFCFDDVSDFIQIDMDESIDETYCLIDFQKEREMLDFYAIQPIITNPHANPAQCVYVHEKMMEKMKQGGTWQRGYIDIMNVRYDIAGYFERLPYNEENDIYRVIATDANRVVDYASRIVVAARPLRYSFAMQDISDAYEQVFPGNLNIITSNYRAYNAPAVVVLEVMCILFTIVAAISIITTVASMYSVISLDTRRRRKEVALRKVHGATTRVIARMFARRYVAICAMCYALLLPALLLLFFSSPYSDTIGIAWWQVWGLTAVIITLITALTIGWKIRDIAHVQPVEWLKE